MNNKIVLGLALFTSFAAQANNCGNLTITLKNNTGSVCTLRSSHLISGAILFGEVPSKLDDKAKAIALQLQQSYTAGPNIRIEYNCNNKVIDLHSRQDLCIVTPGLVKGSYNSNGIHADYNTVIGSWWDSLPGQINWDMG